MAILRWRPAGQAAERWDPFGDVSDIETEMNRLFNGFFGGPRLAAGPERVWAPAVDMYETKDELVVTAELPGMSDKDIKLSIDGDVLSLRGERTQAPEVKAESAYRGERWYGKFERTMPLPFPVQGDKVTATYRDGVLTVTMPKVEEIKPKEIPIQVG